MQRSRSNHGSASSRGHGNLSPCCRANVRIYRDFCACRCYPNLQPRRACTGYRRKRSHLDCFRITQPPIFK